jgi:hypothetical protein
MADYMAYWRNDQVRIVIEDSADGHAIDHAASEQFGKVRPGDTVWIVNIEKGTHRFLLVGRIEVGAVVSQRPTVSGRYSQRSHPRVPELPRDASPRKSTTLNFRVA